VTRHPNRPDVAQSRVERLVEVQSDAGRLGFDRSHPSPQRFVRLVAPHLTKQCGRGARPRVGVRQPCRETRVELDGITDNGAFAFVLALGNRRPSLF
jgi:hypothetical protein